LLLNWQPPDARRDAGEVDVIAGLDGHLFVFEVKSAYVRRSTHEGRLHDHDAAQGGSTAWANGKRLESAAGKGRRTPHGAGFRSGPPACLRHGGIADTSIESDHERFNGFLKVSLEGMIVALRDDRSLLNDPEGLIFGQPPAETTRVDRHVRASLYPAGCNPDGFVSVVEGKMDWE